MAAVGILVALVAISVVTRSAALYYLAAAGFVVSLFVRRRRRPRSRPR